MSYEFTKNWFDNSELKHELQKYLNKDSKNIILEIGSYEGASSVFFSDNFLDHPESKLVCVDPFDTTDYYTPVDSKTKERFLENIKKSKNYNKIIFHNKYSRDFYKDNKEKFNFVYIDGSHDVIDIEIDFINSLFITEKGTVIWMDDYGNNKLIKECIDNLYEESKDLVKIIHKDRQIGFRRI